MALRRFWQELSNEWRKTQSELSATARGVIEKMAIESHIDTPTHLCKFDDGVHEFSHIPMTDRVIVGNVVYRDEQKEQEFIDKIKLARTYYDEVIAKLNQKTKLP